MKTEFRSDEDLSFAIAPFFDVTTSPPTKLTSGAITVNVTAPDGSHPSLTVTRDSTTGCYAGSRTVATGVIVGYWLIEFVHANANAPPQYLVLWWGDTKSDATKNLDATVSSRASTGDVTSARDAIRGSGNPSIADVKAKTDLIPASPASTGDVTSARDSVKGSDARSLTDVYNWAQQGKVVISGTGLATFYKADGTTVLGTAQLKKLDGTNYAPTASEPTQRIP